MSLAPHTIRTGTVVRLSAASMPASGFGASALWNAWYCLRRNGVLTIGAT